MFNYYLTVQHLDTDSMLAGGVGSLLQTKLARFCLNDLSFTKSYIEMPLRCTSNKKPLLGSNDKFPPRPMLYNELVSAKLVRIAGAHYIAGLFQHTSRTTFNSTTSGGGGDLKQGVCLFSLKTLHKSIRHNVRRCHNNAERDLMRGLSFIKLDQKCRTSQLNKNRENSDFGRLGDSDAYRVGDEDDHEDESDFCSLTDNNGLYPIGGRTPALASAILEFESSSLKPMQFDTLQAVEAVGNEAAAAAAAAAAAEGFDIMLLSNKYNELHMFNIKSLNSIPILYRTIRLTPSLYFNEDDLLVKAPQTNMQLDADRTHLYLASKNILYKLRTSSCEQYRTCTECLVSSNSLDPQCGWCAATNQCATKSQCLAASATKEAKSAVESNLVKKWLSSAQILNSDLSSVCVDISRISPQIVSRSQLNDSPRRSTLEVNFGLNLVNQSTDYQCVFQSSSSSSRNRQHITLKTAATLLSLQKLTCPLPDAASLNELFSQGRANAQPLVLAEDGLFQVSSSNHYYFERELDRVELNFYIENSEIRYGTVQPTAATPVTVASLQTRHNITILDCSARRSCLSCLTSSACKWLRNQCVDEAVAAAIAAAAAAPPELTTDIELCASFDTGTSRLLIPFTAARAQAPLQLKLNNIESITTNNRSPSPQLTCMLTMFDGRFGEQNISLPFTHLNHTHGQCVLTSVFSPLGELIQANRGQIQTNLRLYDASSRVFVDSVTMGKLALLFYKCELKAGVECNACLNLNSQLSCMWCSNGLNVSSSSATASSSSSSSSSSCKFMNSKSKLASLSHCVSSIFSKSILNQCDRPQITSVEPRKLPMAGHTLLAISGLNMGTSLDEISKIVLNCDDDDDDDGEPVQIPCDLIGQDYVPGRHMVCRAHASASVAAKRSCRVTVTVRIGSNVINSDEINPEPSKYLTLTSPVSVEYVTPTVSSLEPSLFIQSAKSAWLTVRGEDLDAGRVRLVEVTELNAAAESSQTSYTTAASPTAAPGGKSRVTVSCDIKNVTSTEIQCRLAESFRNIGRKHVRVIYDNAHAAATGRSADSAQIKVTSNPLLKSIDRRLAFYAGGTRFRLHGFNLAAVQSAYAYVSYGNGLWQSELVPAVLPRLASNEDMLFEFPSLNEKFFELVKQQQLIFPASNSAADSLGNERYELQIGFLMDHFNHTLDSQRVLYYPNLAPQSISVRSYEILKSKSLSSSGSTSFSLLIQLDVDVEATMQFLFENENLLRENLQVFIGCAYVCSAVEVLLAEKQVMCALPTTSSVTAKPKDSSRQCEAKVVNRIVNDLNRLGKLNMINVFLGNMLIQQTKSAEELKGKKKILQRKN